MAQTAADALGIDPTLVEAKLGDSPLPKAPVSGGSQSTASIEPAIKDAAMQAILQLAQVAIDDPQSPLHGAAAADITLDKIMKVVIFPHSLLDKSNRPAF